MAKPTPESTCQVSRFTGGDGVSELFLTVQIPGTDLPGTALQSLDRAYGELLDREGLSLESALFHRIFADGAQVGDRPQHSGLLHASGSGGNRLARSVVGQPVLPGNGVGLWACHVVDPRGLVKRDVEGGVAVVRGETTQVYAAGLSSHAGGRGGTGMQTGEVFAGCREALSSLGGTVRDDLLRTWLFVDDIDSQYDGMVEARREFLAREGLTAETHYVVSTGIGAAFSDPQQRIAMDWWGAVGLREEQVRYLAAPRLLSRTDLYGVTFERGAAISYRDRRHVLLAGTASCSSQGKTLHPGDVSRQLDRTMDNIGGLLEDAGASLSHLMYLTAYVRRAEDGHLVRNRLSQVCPRVPLLTLHAPVCRPEWLVEVEGMAIVPHDRPDLPRF